VAAAPWPAGRLLPPTPTGGGSLSERLLAAGAISGLPRRGGLGPRQPGPLPAGDTGTLADAVCDDRR
jgi:hypothetical protein